MRTIKHTYCNQYTLTFDRAQKTIFFWKLIKNGLSLSCIRHSKKWISETICSKLTTYFPKTTKPIAHSLWMNVLKNIGNTSTKKCKWFITRQRSRKLIVVSLHFGLYNCLFVNQLKTTRPWWYTYIILVINYSTG